MCKIPTEVATLTSLSIIIGVLINIGLYGTLFILPLYFQQIKGYNTLKIGFSILPMLVLVAISSYLSGKVISHKGAKIPMVLVLFIGMLGFTSLLTAIQHSANYYWLILPLMAIGFGTAFTMPAVTVVAIYSVPKGREGIASGYFTTGRQIGSLIGVVCFGAIISNSQQLINGMQISLAVSSLLFLFGIVFSMKLEK
ncbi:Spectinomycin tetracycline efflux pump [Piscirickettsia salmonis]|nr:MFS transporter [Piscirickettsia salmonis]QGP50288.1 Spectinomycin tetracycline efflux pump [Piscirickettsia salmonis]